jgi:ATP-dependent exoDNAse (exonuclease V) alpha subunit
MLNESQNLAFKKIKTFLSDPSEKYFTLTAPPGYGKSYLLNHIDAQWRSLNNQREFLQMNRLEEILFGCTTNKGASILNNSQTVHKIFGLYPKKNYSTGNVTVMATSRTKDIGENLLVIDEASMLDPTTMDIIDKYTSKAKVLLVGDKDQLPPVGCTTIPAFSQNFGGTSLTEPMRQDKNSYLFQEIIKLREAILDHSYYAIKDGPGIKTLSGIAYKDAFIQAFAEEEDARILAYTNVQVEGYNRFIRQTLRGSPEFQKGDIVVAANCCNEKSKVEQSYRIVQISNNQVTLDDGNTYKIPENKQAWFKEIKAEEIRAKQSGQWKEYFRLKDTFLDIRDGFSCTVNKSQGSTYNKVFLDLQNIHSCRDLFTLLRLMYVAVSRAKTEVIVYRG